MDEDKLMKSMEFCLFIKSHFIAKGIFLNFTYYSLGEINKVNVSKLSGKCFYSVLYIVYNLLEAGVNTGVLKTRLTVTKKA